MVRWFDSTRIYATDVSRDVGLVRSSYELTDFTTRRFHSSNTLLIGGGLIPLLSGEYTLD